MQSAHLRLWKWTKNDIPLYFPSIDNDIVGCRGFHPQNRMVGWMSSESGMKEH